MRTVRNASPPPPVEPIRIEFYGSDGPGAIPSVAAARHIDRAHRWPHDLEGGNRRGHPSAVFSTNRFTGLTTHGQHPADDADADRRIAPLLALLVAAAVVVVAAAVTFTAAAERTGRTGPGGESDSAATGDALGASAAPPPVFGTLPPVHVIPLPFPGASIEPGRYETDLLGVPLRFTVADATALRTARPGTVMLTPVGTSVSNLAGAPHVTFIRLAAWNSREEAADRTFQGVGSIAADGIESWIADNDVIVDRRSAMVVDGRPTDVLDIRVDPASALGDELCVVDLRPCFWFASVGEHHVLRAPIRLDHALSATMSIRLWVVTPFGSDPILIEAAAVRGDEAWLDRFEATTIATLDIGETAVELLTGAGSGVPASG